MGWLSGWTYRKEFKLDSSMIDADLTNFPVRLHLTSSNALEVFSEIGANSKKIAVTISDGTTETYVEIEKWDNGGEDAELWIKMPSVLAASDTIFYLYYDNAHADNTTYVGTVGSVPAQAVWDANFIAVYHMNQDPNGDVADAIKDSTSNVNHLTPGGSMTTADLVDGPIGDAIDFDGSDDRLSSTSSDFELTSGTLECIYNPVDEEIIINETLLAKWANAPDKGFRFLRNKTSEKLSINVADGSSDDTLASITKISNVETDVACTFTSTALELFIAGVSDNSSVISRAVSYDTSTFYIGRNVGEWYAKGIIDEVRISNIVRSDAWLKATHYSNNDLLLGQSGEADIDLPIVTMDATVGLTAELTLPVIVKDAASVAEYIPKITSEAGSGASMVADLPSLNADARTKYTYLGVQLPSLAIEATVHAVGSADLTLPAVIEDIRPGATPELDVPALTISSEGTIIPIVSVSGNIQPFTIEGYAGARADNIDLEVLTGIMVGTNGGIGGIEEFLPEITLATLAGATSITVLPALTIELEAIQGLIGRLEKYLPKYELEAQAIVEQIATADLNLFRVLVAATGTSYGFNTMSNNLRRLVLEVEGTVGVVGTIDLTLPELEKSSMTGYDNPRGDADLIIRWV